MGHVHAMVVCNSNNSRIYIRRFEGTSHAFTDLMKITSILLCALLLPLSATAQTPDAAETEKKDAPETEKTSEALGDLPVPSWAKSILDSFDKPLHPVIGGVASGGGMAAGVGYESPSQVGWFREGEALFSIRRYWSVAGEIGKRAESRRSQFGVFGGLRHMGRLDFYGIGSGSSFEDRSAFRLRESTFGARGWIRPVSLVRLGGSASMYMPDLGRGAHRGVLSIEDAFPADLVPGLDAEPVWGRYRGFVELSHPTPVELDGDDISNSYQGAYQLAFESARDYETGFHNFHRWEAEVRQRIPGVRKGQRLTLHGFVAATNPDANVPFYMLYTLGGSGGLKSFRPDLLGTDGTQATLRGFRNFRFRGRNLVLMQAEYRVPVYRDVHATVFVDSGQVAADTSEFFKDLKTSTGFSLSYMRKNKTLGRMDVGFGGGEGVRVFWSFGAF